MRGCERRHRIAPRGEVTRRLAARLHGIGPGFGVYHDPAGLSRCLEEELPDVLRGVSEVTPQGAVGGNRRGGGDSPR